MSLVLGSCASIPDPISAPLPQPWRQAASWAEVPVKFEGHRFWVRLDPQTSPKSDPLWFYVDSGGGLRPFTYPDVVKKYGLPERPAGETPALVAEFGKGGILSFTSLRGMGGALTQSKIGAWQDQVMVFDDSSAAKNEGKLVRPLVGDGFFGATFLADSVWRIDYPGKRLWVAPQLKTPIGERSIGAGFLMTVVEGTSRRKTHQPRIAVEIDGEVIPLLLDTGASSLYTATALKKTADSQRISNHFRASSFIRRSVFERWRRTHPDWKFVRGGDTITGVQDLIEVPKVKVAGYEVGPAWFASRSDATYDHYGKNYTGEPTDGALGGNVLKHFIVTIDYPGERVYFEPGEIAGAAPGESVAIVLPVTELKTTD